MDTRRNITVFLATGHLMPDVYAHILLQGKTSAVEPSTLSHPLTVAPLQNGKQCENSSLTHFLGHCRFVFVNSWFFLVSQGEVSACFPDCVIARVQDRELQGPS